MRGFCFENFVITMDFDLVVCVDAFACIHLVMPTIFSSAEEWQKAAASRNDVPEDVWGDLSEERLRYDALFVSYLKNQAFGFSSHRLMTFMTDNWQYEPGDIILDFVCDLSD